MTQTWAAEPPSPHMGPQHPSEAVRVRYRLWSVRQGTRQVRVHDPTALASEAGQRFALSQPTTDDPIARTWSRALAQHAIERGLPPNDVPAETWLAPAWQMWRSDISPPSATDAAPRRSKLWSPAKALDLPVLGAAALCAIELAPLSAETFRLSALFQGDISLFLVRGRSTVLRLPLQQASQFGNSACFFSEPIPPRSPPRRLQHEARLGDLVLLASPPLARWIYSRLEQGIDPWPTLLQLPDDDAFGELIARERASGNLPAGEVLLLLVRTEVSPPPSPRADPEPPPPPPPKPPPPEERVEAHPHDLVEPRHPLAYALKLPQPRPEPDLLEEDLPLPESDPDVHDEEDIVLDLDPMDIDLPMPDPVEDLGMDEGEDDLSAPLTLGDAEDLMETDLDSRASAPSLRLSLSVASVEEEEEEEEGEEEGEVRDAQSAALWALEDVVMPGAVQPGSASAPLMDSGTWDDPAEDDQGDARLDAVPGDDGEDDQLSDRIDSFFRSFAPAIDEDISAPPQPRAAIDERSRRSAPTPSSAVTSQDTYRLISVVVLSSLIMALGLAVLPRLLRNNAGADVGTAVIPEVTSETPVAVAAPDPVPAPTPEAPRPVQASPELVALVAGVTALRDRVAGVEGRLTTLETTLSALETQQSHIAQQDATIQQLAASVKALEARLETLPAPAPTAATVPPSARQLPPPPQPDPAPVPTAREGRPKAKSSTATSKAKADAEPEPPPPSPVAPAGPTAAAPTSAAGQLEGVQARQGMSAGWVRCVSPICAREGNQARLRGAAPAWASPYSETRAAFVGAGQYAILNTQEVAGEIWLEIRFR